MADILSDLIAISNQLRATTSILPDAIALHPADEARVLASIGAAQPFPNTERWPPSLVGMALFISPKVARGTARLGTRKAIQEWLEETVPPSPTTTGTALAPYDKRGQEGC